MSPSPERLLRALARLDALTNWERRDRTPWLRRGLGPIEDLCARLDHPERAFEAVHVAGTKGKGTTSALIAAGLARAGLACGLYLSPHVDRVEERIRLAGREIEGERLAELLERVLAAREAALAAGSEASESTWFDVLTAAAFAAFAEARLPLAVVEVGLGGRLDSTNVVRGRVCVLTNVDLEHVAVLGPTLADIAREKAGIAKAGGLLVSGVAAPEEAYAGEDPAAVVARVVREAGAQLELCAGARRGSAFERDLALARAALDALGARGLRDASGGPLRAELLDQGTALAARLPARLERRRVGGTPLVIDAAHVPSSQRLVLEELAREPELRAPAVVLLALGRDKQAGALLKALRGRADTVLCTSLPSGPLRTADELVALAHEHGLPAEAWPDPARALARALELAEGKGWVLVTGSFYLAGAVRAALAADSAVVTPDTPC